VRPRRAASAATLFLVTLAMGACGEDDGDRAPAAVTRSEPAGLQPADSGSTAVSETDVIPPADAELEAVVRAWSSALNAGDDEAAADLFAPGAIIVQAGLALRLQDRADAVAWNAALPCSGTIVSLEVKDGLVVAVFALGDRLASPCNASPGTLAAAAFLIEDGKIVLWQQVPPPEDTSPQDPPPERAAATIEPRGLTD
jgi:hypothetical protein